MNIAKTCELARRALPLMTPNARAEAEGLIAGLDGTEGKDGNDEAVAAFHSDMRPVCGAVLSALEAGDVEALKGLRALLPHLLAGVNRQPALADLLAHQLGKAFLAGLSAGPEEALATGNGGNPWHSHADGRFTGPDMGGGGGSGDGAPKADSIKDVIEAAKIPSGKETWFDYAEVDTDESKHIQGFTGEDFTGYKHLVDSGTVRKILRDHGDDPSPVTEEDFQKLGDYLKSAKSHHISPEKGKLDRIVHVTSDADGRLMLVEEIRTGRKKLALKTLYRP